jgi:transposase
VPWRRPPGEPTELVERVAALDIGKATLLACARVPHQTKPGRRRQEVRSFATTTRSLPGLADWFASLGVTRVVMESTSTYWKPAFYVLEEACECWLVNAHQATHVPGRPKTHHAGRASGWPSSPERGMLRGQASCRRRGSRGLRDPDPLPAHAHP